MVLKVIIYIWYLRHIKTWWKEHANLERYGFISTLISLYELGLVTLPLMWSAWEFWLALFPTWSSSPLLKQPSGSHLWKSTILMPKLVQVPNQHRTLPPRTPGLKWSSCHSLLSGWDYRHDTMLSYLLWNVWISHSWVKKDNECESVF